MMLSWETYLSLYLILKGLWLSPELSHVVNYSISDLKSSWHVNGHQRSDLAWKVVRCWYLQWRHWLTAPVLLELKALSLVCHTGRFLLCFTYPDLKCLNKDIFFVVSVFVHKIRHTLQKPVVSDYKFCVSTRMYAVLTDFFITQVWWNYSNIAFFAITEVGSMFSPMFAANH